MADRNRAEGWKHAKLTGHENEALLEALVENNGELQDRLLECGKQRGVFGWWCGNGWGLSEM